MELKIFAKTIEEEALNQINAFANSAVGRDCERIAIMPDAHAGVGCVIGTTTKIGTKVCPNFVGVDIGCGITSVRLEGNFDDNFLTRLDNACNEHVRAGREVWSRDEIKCQDYQECQFELLSPGCYEYIKNSIPYILTTMGTLGGGNHFISFEKSTVDENVGYLMVHSGSRYLGKLVALYHQSVASFRADNSNEVRNSVIDLMKRNGNTEKINEVLKYLKSPIITGLEYLEGEELTNYLNDVTTCTAWAIINRICILRDVLSAIGIPLDRLSNSIRQTIHNYVGSDNILRKGAISAHNNEIIFIPLNMRDGTLICVGKGNEEWNYSAPHGAGRIMSRSQANKTISLAEFQRSMEGIRSSSVCVETIDEAPMAYKDWKEIAELIEPTAKIVDHLVPLFNYKAATIY